jgi:hypothetical protein
MGARTKAKAKAGTRERTTERTKDLTARAAGQVKGGKSIPRDFSFLHTYDKASPTLAS